MRKLDLQAENGKDRMRYDKSKTALRTEWCGHHIQFFRIMATP